MDASNDKQAIDIRMAQRIAQERIGGTDNSIGAMHYRMEMIAAGLEIPTPDEVRRMARALAALLGTNPMPPQDAPVIHVP